MRNILQNLNNEFVRDFTAEKGKNMTPLLSEADTEKMITDKGLNAPRLNPDSIDSVIVSQDYHVFSGTSVTVCLLTLKNGYSVVGYSGAVSLENFDADLGRAIAYRDARSKIWQLEGYLLRERLFQKSLAGVGG